ncbi:GNAT family N-acetyltransferase [Actinoplanes sp. N902-109]|uniref:GNAT family N-acetyltransferase n=1 Tax=Actinoplanes sp. (strain N902-109) TaxID=649831 RepID=UPI0003295E4F|nr:GNAT family N-acetyltransferase [Actinoplanes sp. N902-109]AGL15035.1 GCN5-like N-acetyltransferase [Actinoplanes sp. N902-109]
MLIESRPATDPELATLLVAQQCEAGDGAYLVGVVQGRAVACGGWRALGRGVAELQHLYVRPAFRGRGLAGQLIVALEEEALAADRPLLRLVAGTDPATVALCRSAGYDEVPGRFFEKSLLLTSR